MSPQTESLTMNEIIDVCSFKYAYGLPTITNEQYDDKSGNYINTGNEIHY